jgi:alkyl sulfatase BDS1-like metallo-beta-lactamase superfamily hydrolase
VRNSFLAEDMKFTINLLTPDNGEKYAVEMSNATLTNIKGFVAEDPDLTITVNRSDLLPVMMGSTTLDAQIKAGKAKLEGKAEVLQQLKSAMVHFELGFEILPGTKPQPAGEDKRNPFAQEPLGQTEGG